MHNTQSYNTIMSSLELLKKLQTTHSTEMEKVWIEPCIPDYEVAYSMEPVKSRVEQIDFKLPDIEKYVNVLPSATTKSQQHFDFDLINLMGDETSCLVPFDFRHYRYEIPVDFIKNKKGVPKTIQYTTLPRFTQLSPSTPEKNCQKGVESSSSIKNKKKQKLMSSSVVKPVGP